MAVALTDLSGIDFYVVKSGHQYGSDVRSAPHNLFRVGLEAKRLGKDTALSRDALIAKITEASTAKRPVDLWILATSRDVDSSDREALQIHGERLGISVLVLDCPKELSALCDLVMLCASPACMSILDPDDQVLEALSEIRDAGEYVNRRAALKRQLVDGRVGYESARMASRRWMRNAQRSLAKAKPCLGGHHNLSEAESGVVYRQAINTQLEEWYESGHKLAALIGDEGMGKSWAELDWYRRLESSAPEAPLPVFLNARYVDLAGAKMMIAQRLARQTGVMDEGFWRRRLELWERSGRTDVRVLVLLDGLNENYHFRDWSDWLQPLLDNDLSGMYRVVVSCWPNWWRRTLFRLPDLMPKAREIEVKGFDGGELEEMLTAKNAQRSDFPESLIDLMRVPRLCALVFEYREELQSCGDVTAERVAYEDWKDRLARRGRRTCGVRVPNTRLLCVESEF